MNLDIQKLRRQLQEKGEKVRLSQIAASNAQMCENYLPLIPHLQTYQSPNLTATLESYSECPDSLSDWIVDLTIRNMREIYQNSWKWDEETKSMELLSTSSRYLVALKGEDNPVGFIHFRFEQLDGDFVCYIYDVQLEQSVKDTELASFLITAVEHIAARFEAQYVVTFVFKADTEYMGLLQKMKYTFHKTSPSLYNPDHPEKYKHEIMCKELKI